MNYRFGRTDTYESSLKSSLSPLSLEIGKKRYNLTRNKTMQALLAFRLFVRQYGLPNCACWKYFGIK